MKNFPTLASTLAASLILVGPAAAQFAATGDGVLGHFYERAGTASPDRQQNDRHFGYQAPEKTVRVSAEQPVKEPAPYPGMTAAQGKTVPNKR